MSHSQRTIFFILGCQKSGTTWVQKLLAAHPNIACGGEGHLTDLLLPVLQQAVAAYNQRQQRRAASGLDVCFNEQDFASLIRHAGDIILAKHLRSAGGRDIHALGDKTPEYALGIASLAAVYPAARFIHVIRDPRDGAVSGWWHWKRIHEQQAAARENEPRFASFPQYAMYFVKHHWIGYIQSARAAAQQIEPEHYLEVRYEDLHKQPHETVTTMLRHLCVAAAPHFAQQCLEAADFTRLARGRMHGEENRNDFFRKGVVGDWRSMFDADTLAAFHDHAGELMGQHGYAIHEPVEAA